MTTFSIAQCILALVPIVVLAVELAVLRIPAHKACAVSCVLALVLAIAFWAFPIQFAATAALEGILNALWPICWVIIAALFTYNITVQSGAMETIKRMLGSISKDSRVLVLLIGWGFANFMEGMAGFGTAVAIPASMLVGLGLNPLRAVVGCLVMNSTPTCFGSVGVPTITLSNASGVDLSVLTPDIVMSQWLLAVISPFFLVCICCGGLRALRGVVPLTCVASISYVVPWFAAGCFLPAELPDIVAAACSMACIVAFSKVASPAADSAFALLPEGEGAHEDASISLAEGLRAWAPYLLVFVLLLCSSLVGPVHQALASVKTALVVYAGENPATLTFSWLSAAGTLIFVAAFAGGAIQGCSFRTMLDVLGRTLRQYWKTVATICCVLAMAKVMSYSGMVGSIAAALVVIAGPAYPLVAPIIGVLGGFVTGSGTSTSVLFGALQSQTAASLGLSESWMAAANIMGAGIGKMVCPQSIAIGAGAAGLQGQESDVLKSVAPYFAIYVVASSVLCMAGSLIL